MLQKSPPRNRPLVPGLSARFVFGIFGAFAKIGPDSHETTRKIEVSEELGQCPKRRLRDGGLRGESGPRTQGIWSRKWPFSCQVIFPSIPPLQMLRSAAGSVLGTKSPPLRDQIPLLQCVCTYIYIYAVKLLSGPSLGVSGVIIWSK